MRIAELYASLQGEGLLTGTPSIFVRASGCNLRCWFCDTPYTSWLPEGEDRSVEEIVAEIARLTATQIPLPPGGGAARSETGEGFALAGGAALSSDSQTLTPALSQGEREIGHVVITGGEPMLFAELLPLCDRLRGAGMYVTIETAGTLFLPVACDLMSISPKLASSTPTADRAGRWSRRHEQTRHQPDVIRRLTSDYDYQLKFVIDTPADCAAVETWLNEFPHLRRDRVLLMPQGTDLASLAAIGDWLAPYCREHGYLFCPRKHIEWYGTRRGT